MSGRKALTFRGLVLAGARFHWRSELAVFIGVAVSAAVLVGAVLVGDCVKYSLRRAALLRLGRAVFAMNTQGRFFDSSLADRVGAEAGAEVAPALAVNGIAIFQPMSGGEACQMNRVRILGADSRFMSFGGAAAAVPAEGEAAINRKLADALGVRAGDEIAVRAGRPGLMPRDAPLASRNEELSVRGSFVVKAVLDDEAMGRFSLEANQVSPYNVFLPMGWLQGALGLAGRANLMVVSQRADGAPDAAALDAALRRAWRIEDAGLELKPVMRFGLAQLQSDRVFLDPATSDAATGLQETAGVGVLTYLVNRISLGAGGAGAPFTPYSFMVACDPDPDGRLSPVPDGMGDDEILLARWTADNLGAKPGDEVTVAYHELTGAGGFTERARVFKVRGILEMDRLAMERDLMPEFPGLTDVEQCAEWNIGMPMDEALLADKANQEYWEHYRATPKAVVTLAAGRGMWANRFGDLSAVRYAATGLGVTVLREELKAGLSPQALGLFFFPARQQALESVAKAMNFGELFVSMSFVLIAAALMLAGLLFVFNVEQRAEEAGILRAIGFLPYHTMALFLAEGAVVALAGSAVGAVIGTAYTRLLVWGLSGEWRGAVAGSSIVYHAEAGSAAAGAAAAAVCSVFAMALALRKQTKRQARELLSGDAGVEAPRAGGGRRGLLISTALIAAAIAVIAALAPDDAGHRVAGFFSAGAMLLIGGMGLVRNRLGALALRESGRITLREIGIRGAARRRGRSLAAAGLLACGCFIVFAVLAMQQDVTAGARLRSSGTGGFGIYAESTIPVVDRLETEQGRSAFKLGEGSLSGLSFVSMKIRDGDDASCFNLNRAMAPRLVGVVPEAMSGRGAFVARDGADPWKLLDEELPDGLVPGLAGDVNTAMWGLQKKTGPEKGDVLAYKDERGDMFGVKLVGSLPQHLSVMQGVVLVSAARFSEKFPSEEGYRAFLADVPEGADPVEAARLLGTRMARAGLDAVPAAQRLGEFYSVESTYLSMFMALGGFGLLLGTAGMGVVVLRNVLERRRELSAMRCMGFMRGDLVRMLLIEHAALLAAGVAIGAASSLAAVWPNVSGGESWAQGGRIVLFLAGILVSGLLWIALSARIGLRGDMLAGLRDE